jgi:metallopeptidase MepB
MGAFVKPPQAPPTFIGTPDSIIADTKTLIEKSRSLQDRLVEQIKPDQARFQNAILPQAQANDEDSLEANILCFYSAVATDKKIRDASTEAEQLFADFAIESNMREDVFKLADAAWKAEHGKLGGESWRLLDKERKSYIRYGLGLPAGPKRDRFKEIKTKLSEISIQFAKRLNEENGGLYFRKEELEGVPKDLVESFAAGEGEHAGKVKVDFKYPSLFPVLKYAKHAYVRQQMYIANENKCNANVPLFKEAIVLRDEAARLLGYPNHAAFIIEEKMLKTPETVNDFLGDLSHRLKDGGRSDLEQLNALKKADMLERGDTFDGKQYLWDKGFYETIMLQKDYQIGKNGVFRHYFELTSYRPREDCRILPTFVYYQRDARNLRRAFRHGFRGSGW